MPTRSTFYPGGIEASLRAPGVLQELRKRARRVKTYAVRISNVGTRNYVDGHGFIHPGHYKRSWHYRTGYRKTTGRPYARVYNTASYAIFLEFGTRHMRAYRVLTRAMTYVRR